MRTFRFHTILLCLLLTISVGFVACQRHTADPKATTFEPYAPVGAAVGFYILPAGGQQAWLATYTDEGRTTKFRIEFNTLAASDDKSLPAAVMQGRFIGQEGSNPIPLLSSLKKVLQAKHMPRSTEKVDEILFEYTILSEKQSRASTGYFSSKPGGDWTTMKVSLGKGEFFLNINTVAHQAEFSIKDPKYGDIVLGELAKVL